MAEKSPYIKIKGVQFHKDAGKLKLEDFVKTHEHLSKRVDLEKAHAKLKG